MLGNAGLSLPPLTDAVRDDLNGIIQDFGWAANPADLTGFLHTDAFPHIVESMTNQAAVGTLVIASGGTEDRAEQVIQLREETGKVLVYLWTGTRTDSRGLTTLKSAAVPIFYSPAALARGLKSQQDYFRWRDKRLSDGFASSPPATREQGDARAQLATF